MNASQVGESVLNGTVGTLVIELLSYGSMLNEEVTGNLLTESSPYDLGLVINAWYQMAFNVRGKEVTEKAGRETAQFFQEQIEADGPSQVQKVSASFARSLMLDLVAGLDDRYAELWNTICTDHAETVPHVGALFLGWAIGVLNEWKVEDKGETFSRREASGE